MNEFIQKTIKLENGNRIVLYDSEKMKGKVPIEELNRNICRIDKDDNILWRIKSYVHENWGIPFIKMKLRDKKLIAFSWAGGEYEVNLDDGSIKLLREHR